MNESIMKTDRLGRLRYAPEQKAAVIEAYHASGMSAPRFAGSATVFLTFFQNCVISLGFRVAKCCFINALRWISVSGQQNPSVHRGGRSNWPIIG
ncbi:MAG: hypothetical protein EAZ81_12825 [Verrucomicrobia bacterium]|nr:MAG: hypothetical protein EAZ81_12825 [Verrucomicrobiota bacterium]